MYIYIKILFVSGKNKSSYWLLPSTASIQGFIFWGTMKMTLLGSH